MKKIIFLDIDGTLFNVSVFINLFHKKLVERFGLTDKDILELRTLYDDVKKENGYFLPSLFLNKITKRFSSVNEKQLEEIFNNVDLFEKSVYKDTSVIKSLADLAIFGVFSQGEEMFQKRKIAFMKNLLDDGNVHIFPDKLRQAKQVFNKYGGYEIFLVDDNLNLLTEVRSMYPNISVILIDRNDRFRDNKDMARIKDLSELKSII
ncbi:MAG: hypothetical protein AAB520_03770 [Patescibacteria group bacterium]